MKIPYLKRAGDNGKRGPTRIDRRHLLKFVGGSALGAALSPLPWKILDDVSIWTQNWSWIPVPVKGETVIRHTSCALCPAGCGVKVRCVGAQPVALFGLPDHPTSHGFLCPAGLLGHHLPYHPERVVQPTRMGAKEAAPVSRDQVLSELGRILSLLRADSSAGRVAVIDAVPGGSTSVAYRRFVSQFPSGTYILPPDGIKRSLRVFDGIGGDDYPELGIDVEQAGAILSFGANLFEGWGTPGRFLQKRCLSEPACGLTQIEPRYSNTAALADVWLPARPGTEPILALGLAAVIVSERRLNSDLSSLVDRLNEMPDFRDFLVELSPDRVAEACGINQEAVTRIAREIGAKPGFLALVGAGCSGGPFSEDDYLAVNFLNLLGGALGSTGGLVPRRSLPKIDLPMAGPVSSTDLSEIPDESIAFLIIDATVPRESIPSALIRRKLVRDNPIVVSLSWSGTEYADLSHYVLPVPLYLEAVQEIPTPSDSPVASFSLSVPVLPALSGACSPVEWISRLARSARLDWPAFSADSLVEAQIKAIWDCRRGSVYTYTDGLSKANSDFASAQELAKAFSAGACWLDGAADPPVKPEVTKTAYFKPETWGRLKGLINQRIEVSSKSADEAVTLMLYATPLSTTIASPLAGKLTRESGLYARPGEALLSSSTAARLALGEGQAAELQTAKGRVRVRVHLDESVVPDVVFVPVSGGGSDPRNLCEIDGDGVWRGTPAKLRRLDV